MQIWLFFEIIWSVYVFWHLRNDMKSKDNKNVWETLNVYFSNKLQLEQKR